MSHPLSGAKASITGFNALFSSPTSVISYRAGTRIYRVGDAGDSAYMINNGYVELYATINGRRESLELLGPGDIFGEMELFDGKARSVNALALHDTNVFSISRSQLLDEINQSGPLIKQILVTSVNRLRSLQTQRLQAVEQRIELDPVPQGKDISYSSTRAAAARQLKQRVDIENAIRQDQFNLVYQPIVNLLDGRTAGFEALLRWSPPGSQVISPDEFIPLAERFGLIVPLGAWTLENALKTLSIIERTSVQFKDYAESKFMSVNVSPRQLENEWDVERLANLIEQADINPANLKLEITEQALLADPSMATVALARLKSTGASIAIDDFGTGYSSLNYLHQFPLDTLKIDRSFVSRIVEDENRQHVVRAIIGLAREMGMDVVAEGVEERDELAWLRMCHCRYAQGYLLAKPLKLSEALPFLERDFDF